MGMFDNNASKKFWSPSKVEEITGDIVAFGEIHARDFNTGQPKYTRNGRPVTQQTITLATDAGEVVWAFNTRRAVKEGNQWVHYDSTAVAALKQAAADAGLMFDPTNLGGANITVRSPKGTYAAGNPRPFIVQINGVGTHPYRGVEPFEPIPMPEMQVTHTAAYQPPMQQQMPAYPTDQQAIATAQNIMNSFPGAQVSQVLQQPMPSMAPMQQPMQQPMQAMPMQNVYDDSIPF